jgi:radical SAM superfamily enzyme YgiQ (UPF0313 family)
VRVALVFCPYLSNGEAPPLGLASINGALLQAGHETVPFDLAWLAYAQEQPFLHHLRQVANIGQAGRRVQFLLHPELLLCHLFGHQVLGEAFARRLARNPVRRQAEAASVTAAAAVVERWARLIADARPDAVLYSAYISNLMLTLPLAMAVKRRLGVPVVLGGAGVGLPEVQDFVLRLPADPAQPPERGRAVDAIVVREGELTAVELVARLAATGPRAPGWQAALADVPGVAVLDADGRLRASERPLAPALDDLPRASFAGFPVPGAALADYGDPAENRYADRLFHGAPIAATRGCVNRCAYCSESAWWRRYRQRSVASLVDEIDQRHAQTAARHFLFCDSALNGNRDWLLGFCAAVAGRGYTFLGHAIPGRGADAEVATAMARAGFLGVTLGVETLCERTLRAAHKRLGRAEVDEALASFTAAGLRVKVNILCGFPGETEADHEECARALAAWVRRDAGRRIWWAAGQAVRLEPHSPYWQDPDAWGIRIRREPIGLPPALDYLAAALAPLCATWNAGVSEAEVARWGERLRAIVAGPPGPPLPALAAVDLAPIRRRCLAIVAESGLGAPCRRDVLAALDFPLGAVAEVGRVAAVAALPAGADAIWRAVALWFAAAASALVEAGPDGATLPVAARDAPLLQIVLHNAAVNALARTTVSGAGAAQATRLLARALGAGHGEVGGRPPDEAAYRALARGRGGGRAAADLRLLWDGTPHESEAEPCGAALGAAAFVWADRHARHGRLVDLPPATVRDVVAWAAGEAALVESGSACGALRSLAARLATDLTSAVEVCARAGLRPTAARPRPGAAPRPRPRRPAGWRA